MYIIHYILPIYLFNIIGLVVYTRVCVTPKSMPTLRTRKKSEILSGYHILYILCFNMITKVFWV